MRFVLHSSSLADEILSEDSPAHRLVKVNCLKEIEVIPLPTDKNSMRKRFSDNGLVFSEYFPQESRVVLKLSDGSIHDVTSPFANRLPENLWEPIISNSNVTLANLWASTKIGDYLVVSKTEPSLKCKVARNSIITAEQALEMVRIILTAHNRFYLSAEEPVTEWSYYLYRTRKIFKGLHYASMVVFSAHGKEPPEKIHNHFRSLMTRLNFICRAYDKIAFFCLKTPNYNDQDSQLYHLVYFVMLITGVFDGLAYIIHEFYHMNIDKSEYLDLRVLEDNENKKAKKFYQDIQFNNPALYQFLTAADTQSDIKTFYPLRNSLVHRELLVGVQLQNGSEPAKNVFEINSETYERLKELSNSFTFISGSNPSFLDPFLFIKWAQEVTIRIVDRVVSSIDWDSVCITLPLDTQDKVHASNESYEQEFGQLLGWSEEPLYF